MLRIILLSFFLAVSAQYIRPGTVIDTIHGYHVEYDDRHDLMLIVGKERCYVVETNDERRWDALVHDADDLHAFTDAMYKDITANSTDHLTPLSHSHAWSDYHSSLERWQCDDKDVFLLSYTPPPIN